jgi:hypothetical protein
MTAVLKDDAELYKQFSDNPEFRRTIEGAIPMPSAFSITFGVLPSMTATHELVDADNFVMEHTPRGRRRAPPASEKPCDARLGRHQQGAVAGTRQLSLGPPRGLPYQKSPNPSDVRARCLRNGISKTSAACHCALEIESAAVAPHAYFRGPHFCGRESLNRPRHRTPVRTYVSCGYGGG